MASRLVLIDCWVTHTRRAAHASDGTCAPRRTGSMPVAHPLENAFPWRIHYSEIDRIEVSTPLAPCSSQRISLNRTEFSAADFRFFAEYPQ